MAKTRLNAIKKMEYEEDGHKDLLNGINAGLKGNITSPTPDCNSNNVTVTKENMFLCSTDSIQDCSDFLQDNSEYQWFLDYGSQDLIYYDYMARNIDANLAEVDMDDFNREDIHSALSSLPNMQGVEEREMFASVTSSMMVKFDFDSCISPRSISQEEQINGSICKSQLLFSPVRESYLPNSNLSVDSLDISENDVNLMVTCQSNKNNYTIAFEGSTIMASDESESRDGNTCGASKSDVNITDVEVQNQKQSCSKCGTPNSRHSLVTSDSTFTTWSKIKENPTENLHLRRHPSGNNNIAVNDYQCSNKDISTCNFKSLSLPNLFRPQQKQNSSMSLSVKLNSELKGRSISNEYQYVKLYDIQSKNMNQSTRSPSKNPVHNFSLVKLFIKQKSASHEGMSNYTAEHVNTESCKNSNKCQAWPNSRNNEINRIITDDCLNNLDKTSTDGGINVIEEGKTKLVDSKPLKHVTSLPENLSPKSIFSEHDDKKKDHNGYYSDESTQENGSNTESTENLTCHCINAPVIGNKKLTEKSIQTSKMSVTNENSQKKPLKVPVYILYPNYSLPNLEFLKKEHYIQNIDFSKVFLRPQKFQMQGSPTATPKSSVKSHGKRPFSVNDIETLKKTGFKHVRDWESLTFLLPKEYKQFLQDIPEIVAQLKDVKNVKEEMVPLFCLSPPPSRRMGKRPSSCDINISNDGRSSNFSSTATQPSSGYRGSSTMLNSNASHNTNSPRNPSFSYRYDTNSESGSSRRSGCLPHYKNYSINSDDSNENYPTRPPLPKSILRNNSLDSQQYTCKTQKEYANKRYSMVELTDKNLMLREKNTKRRSLHGSKSPQSVNKEHRGLVDNQTSSKKSAKNAEFHDNSIKSNLENDMKRLEELLEISAVFGESVESFNEADMMKLRSQVSKFLTMQKNLERVSETLQTVDEGKSNEVCSNKIESQETHPLGVKQLQTPHNTPEHKKQTNKRNTDINTLLTKDYLKPCNCNGRIHEFEEEDCKFNEQNLGGLKKTVSFAERIVAVNEHKMDKENASSNFVAAGQKNNQVTARRPMDLPICEESVECSRLGLLQNSSELLHKRELVSDVGRAVRKILTLCKEANEDPANLCLHHLCPSLYAVLSDGLKEEIDTPFGPIRNSVWSVIEASSQQGPMTQTLNELVQRLNREDIFTEGLIKFNAFIFGLLNARALSGWFSYLRTRDSMLHKYYDNSGLLLISNTAGAPVRILVDQLINIMEPLCTLQFNLDLLYQTKLLHCSLQNLNSLLEEPSNNDFLTPTKQFMLLKLVQSIQNSLSQSGEGKRSKHVLEDIERKTSDPPVGHLLEKNKIIRARRGGSKIRPRSGCDSAVGGLEVTDVASAMTKRWSGVNLNSKLVEAFDRLVDDSESDYTDSLDITAPHQEREVALPAKNIRKEKLSNISAEHFEVDLTTKEQKKNILLNLNKKSSSKTEDSKTETDKKEFLENSAKKVQNCGQKFKRLQQKWERWEKSGRSPSDSDSDMQSPLLEKTPSHRGKGLCAKSPKSEKSNCDSTMPSPTSRTSKIPRLLTSPMSNSPNTKWKGTAPKLVSPTYSSDSNQKTGKLGYVSRKNNSEERIPTASGNVCSKADDKVENFSKVNFGKNQTASSTSFPQKRYNTTPVKKREPISRRVASASLNRKPAGKKLHEAQRTVRTLTHRLPSDSGHLSFNEGERLKVVLEVDKAWLLCCRDNRKGLVPKSLVISDVEDKF